MAAADRAEKSVLEAGTGRRFLVGWAGIRLGGVTKIRPVVILDQNPDGVLVLAMTSSERSTWAGFTQVSAASAASFDRKATPGWINCREVYQVPVWDLTFHGRLPGSLSAAESRTVLALLSEWVFDPLGSTQPFRTSLSH